MICNKNCLIKFDKKLKEQFFNTYIIINNNKYIINLFYCCEKVFILMNIWMIGKNLMKHYYMKKDMKDITEAGYGHTKRICKDFEIKNLG